MRSIILLAASATLWLFSCSKNNNIENIEPDKKLIEVNLSYQEYSFGELSPIKNEWGIIKYNSKGLIEFSSIYDLNYLYGINQLIYQVKKNYTYNNDKTINTLYINYDNLGTVYENIRYFYDSNKKLVKREIFNSKGWTEVEEYNNGLLSKVLGLNNALGSITFIDTVFFENNLKSYYLRNYIGWDGRFRGDYKYDSKGNLTEVLYTNLNTNFGGIIYNAFYEYDDEGRIKSKIYMDNYPTTYQITYSYNNNQITKEEVKKKDSENDNFTNWLLITYEYVYN